MAHRERCLQVLSFLCFCCAVPAEAQTATPALQAAKALDVQQTRYELRQGESAQIAASSGTLDFLANATGRRLDQNGAQAAGLVVGTDTAGNTVVAASQRAKPGDYSVTLTATSATGEQRLTALTVSVKPRQSVPSVPSGSTRPPVVLLNGWQVGITGACPIASSSSDTFGNLAQYLVSDGAPIVYLFDNCLEDPSQLVETLGNDLGDFLNSIQYANGQQVPQIDLVAFNLGGLIVRSYLSGLQPDQTLSPPNPTLVRDLVLIATPNFGSFVAGNYVNSIAPGTQSAEMVPGSALQYNLANWNQRTDDLQGVNAVAVIGNAGTYTANLSSSVVLNNASDGLESLTSASAGFVTLQPGMTRIVPYCAVDPTAFTNTATFGPFACNAPGIANVNTTTQQTGLIVRSFLSGTSDWKSIGSSPSNDPYLSQSGGMLFSLASAGGSFVSDLTSLTWGTLQLTPGGNATTTYYGDFLSGTGVLQPVSASLGTVNCGSYTQVAGFFSALRCKIATAIFSIGPQLSGQARVVAAGSNITIAGASFSGQCIGCKVVATPAGSSTGQNLQVSSWTNTSITAALPASLTGFLTITVFALPGADSLTIMSVAPSPSTIAAAPTSLQFSYTTGGTVPNAQSVQITNSGSGTLAWTATSDSSWLTVSPSSGTAPSTLSISVTPGSLSAGTYSGNIQITASGASNTPLTIPVTFTVTAAPPVLAVAPQSLTFNYTVGGSAPAAQTVAITNAGAGSLSWTAAASDYWLVLNANSGSAPGTLSISINPANLAAGTYTTAVPVTATGASGSPVSIAITLVVQGTQPAGTITSVANGASYQPGIASATWLSIFGADLSSTTYIWQTSDFLNGLLPTSLQGVSVTVNGVPAFVEYVSPTQINVLAPDGAATGTVQVQVTAAQQGSNSFSTQKNPFAPAFFTIDNGLYAAALHADYTLIGSVNLIPGVTTRPAQPGETILLYATGFGPTNPPLPTSQLVSTPAVLANQVQVTIGGMNAPVAFAGLVSPGLYQFNVAVPGLPNGDAAVVATIGGVSTPTGLSIPVQQ